MTQNYNIIKTQLIFIVLTKVAACMYFTEFNPKYQFPLEPGGVLFRFEETNLHQWKVAVFTSGAFLGCLDGITDCITESCRTRSTTDIIASLVITVFSFSIRNGNDQRHAVLTYDPFLPLVIDIRSSQSHKPYHYTRLI